MKYTSITIKAAKISAYAIVVAAIISGLFLFFANKTESGKSIISTIVLNDSSKAIVTNNQNEIKGDFINGDKIVVIKKESKDTLVQNIDAQQALIITQNQNGDNTLNVTQISDSYATSNDVTYIKGISYPSSGEFGLNILDKNTDTCKVGIYSMRVEVPNKQEVIVKVSGTHWSIPVFQAIPGWRDFDFERNGTKLSRKFKSVKSGIIDYEMHFDSADEIELSVFENGSKVPSWQKTIIVKE